MQHIIHCPQPGCAASAEIVDRWVWLSTHGSVEHVKTWCANGQPTPNLPEPALGVTVG